MTVMKFLYIILTVLVITAALSFLRCRSTNHLVQEQKPDIEEHFSGAMHYMDRFRFHPALNKVGEITDADIVYIEDKRTDLCFAVFFTSHPVIVPCGHLNTVDTIIIGD